MDAKARPDDCAALYDALPGARGDDLVGLLQAAPFDCIVYLERHGSAALQFAVATEANVLDVARAIPDIVRDYDGTYESVRLRNLLRFLLVVQDIHRWCVQGSRSGTCADGIWDAAEPWSIASGSDVHDAISRAVAAIRDNAHFGDASGEHGETLLDVGFLIRDYGYNADHLDIVVWWLDRWDTRYTEAQFRLFFQVLFDILHTGHRDRSRFGPAFGENRALLDVLARRAQETSLLGTEWERLTLLSAVELGRFTLYPESSNYVRVRDAIRSIRAAYENDVTLRPVWLRVVAEVDYNDAANCGFYGMCDYYEGEGFNANFRNELFVERLECPANHCPADRITVFAQDLGTEKLALACERLAAHSRAFHELFDTNCEPVDGDLNDHLSIYVFNDGLSCNHFSSAAFFRNADVCRGVYYEWDPADPTSQAYAVVTEYESWQQPRDAELGIWNFEHEYAHYLDGRYNRHGGYSSRDSLHWWTEGMAEYFEAEVSPYIDPPAYRTPFTLEDILLHSDSLPTGYWDRHLAVRFFMQNHPEFIDTILGYMRRGEYDAYQSFLEREAGRYSDGFERWLSSGGMPVGPVRDEAAPEFVVPLFPRFEAGRSQGFVRVINRSGGAGEVRIVAVDDAGNRKDTVTLSLAAGETRHFNSRDLESGNAGKGLPQGVGTGTGDWRLELRSDDLEFLALAYVRTRDGSFTPMSEVAERREDAYLVPTFNPASNEDQVSLLRIGNLGNQEAEVIIEGVDDAGATVASMGVRIDGFATRTLTARELERGGEGLEGLLGDGVGKWRLRVSSDEDVFVMSLLESRNGHLTNLSALPPESTDAPWGAETRLFRPTVDPK